MSSFLSFVLTRNSQNRTFWFFFNKAYFNKTSHHTVTHCFSMSVTACKHYWPLNIGSASRSSKPAALPAGLLLQLLPLVGILRPAHRAFLLSKTYRKLACAYCFCKSWTTDKRGAKGCEGGKGGIRRGMKKGEREEGNLRGCQGCLVITPSAWLRAEK